MGVGVPSFNNLADTGGKLMLIQCFGEKNRVFFSSFVFFFFGLNVHCDNEIV